MRPDPWNGALVVTGDPNRLSEQASIVLGENLGDTGPGVHGLHCAPLLERACRQIWSVATTLPDSTPKPVLDAMLSVLEDQLLTALVQSVHTGSSVAQVFAEHD
jgi:hypothetical protein